MMAELEGCTAVKKMKQGRLPFKPLSTLDHVTGGNTPGSKKRKLSENESPSSKQLKISLNTLDTVKPTSTECDHEVSSSSEAELLNLGHHKGKKINTIDKFFKLKPITHEQEEITSTNECISIDLTEDMVIDDLKCITKANVTLDNDNGDDLQKISANTGDTASDMLYDCYSESIGELNVSSKNECAEDKDENIKEDKEYVDMEVIVIDNEDDHSTADDSFIADSSVCENALKTPVKDKPLESMLKAESSCSSTPSQDSVSDGTPSSVKITNKPISECKRTEREEQRKSFSGTKEEREQKRLQKQKEKEDKELERLEKKRQKEEEKVEKEKLKQEEKDKKDRERLEKLKQKEEEKKLREKELEAKLEEKRKKDEEKKQKDEEKRLKEEEKKKEEEEKLRKEEKKKEMFKGFFIKKDPIDSPPKPKENKNGLFMPFELKPHMKLAPGHRRFPLTVESRIRIDEAVSQQGVVDRLYLDRMKSPSFKAGKSSATWPRKIPCDDGNDDDDVELLSHEKETIEKVTHHVKFLHFEENTRPPYYGTWRKRSKILTGRNPFKQDQNLFDYEVDSDDEWEEEEPGESVSSDEEDEEAEKNEDDDPDADDWMVPHGYLSDGEGVDDDEVDKASKQDLQKVRQAAWESELKRQAKPLKMVSIGCVWEDDNMITIADQQLEILLKFKAVCLMEEPISTTFKLRVSDTASFTKADKPDDRLVKHNSQRKSVPEEAIPDLIRLVHGNPIGIKNLIKEFRMFWKLKANPDAAESNIDVSMEVEMSSTDAPKSLNESRTEANEQFQISKRQLELKIPAIAVREKRPDHKKVCWYVREEVLKQYNIADITLPNSWEYVCVKKPTWAEDKTPKVDDSISQRPAGKTTPTILQFAQPMSPTRLQAIGSVGGNAIRESDRQEAGKDTFVVVEKTPEMPGKADIPGKPVISSDQRLIKDMFSPGLLKEQNKLNQSTGCITNNTDNNNVMVTDIDRSSTSSCTLNKSVKIVLESIDGKKAAQRVPGHVIVNSKLSSPECIKTSPKLNKDLKDSEKEPEQPVDVDLIVID